MRLRRGGNLTLAASDWLAYWLTLKLAFITTVLLLIIAVPLAWWLAGSQSRLRPVCEAIVALPMVLPPTVIGFYLLVAMSPTGWLGQANAALGFNPLVFTFPGLVIASVLYSLPFVVQPLQASFAAISQQQLDSARLLGAGRFDRLLHVVLPLARPGLVIASVMGFAHTLGEFGVVLMVGGSIPGETRVLSVALFEHVESLDYASAHRLAASLLILSFLMLLLVYRWQPIGRLSRWR